MERRYVSLDFGFSVASAITATVGSDGSVFVEKMERIPEPTPQAPPVSMNRHERRKAQALARRRCV